MSDFKLFVLGPPHIERGGEPVAIDTRKSLALVACLAVSRLNPGGETYSREALATLLWPESEPRRSRAILRRNLSVLRKALEGEWLVIEREAIGADPNADVWLDVECFRALLHTWEEHDHPKDEACPDCMADLDEAVDLYRGDFLEGFSQRDSPGFDDWQRFETESLRQELTSALERLAGGHSAAGEYRLAIPYARRWVTLDPLHEPAQYQLMQLYAEDGQHSAALRQYQECVRVLDRELGLQPGPEITRLYNRLRVNRLLEKDPSRQIPNVGLLGAEPETIFGDQPVTPVAPSVPDGPLPPSPYRGLFAFREEDAPFFFGRELFTGRLVEEIERRSLVAVIGPSGSGKSSVIQAGLLPHFRQQGDWAVVTLRPGRAPFQAAAHALLPLLEPDFTETETLIESRRLAEALQYGELPMADVVRRI